MAGLKNALKLVAFSALGSAPVLARRLAAIRRTGAVTILNLHRVSDDDGSGYRPLAPGLFDELLTYLKQHFAITTFARLHEDADRPRLILSFDDAYKDFIDVAVPVLARHGLAANQNVIPDCVETGLPPLNIIAQDFVGKAPGELVRKLDVPGFAMAGIDPAGYRLSAFIKNKSQAEQDRLRDVLIPQFHAWDAFRTTAMMTRDEIVEVAGAHEIGAHSYHHASMRYETEDYVRDDVRRCQDYFGTRLGLPMNIYAFPNGSHDPAHIRIVREAGVEHVLLVAEDFDNGRDGHKRFTFDALGSREVRFRALGGLRRVAA